MICNYFVAVQATIEQLFNTRFFTFYEHKTHSNSYVEVETLQIWHNVLKYQLYSSKMAILRTVRC